MDAYGEDCMRPFLFVDAQQVAAAIDAGAYWNGMMTGYVLALLTILVVIAILNRLGPRRPHG